MVFLKKYFWCSFFKDFWWNSRRNFWNHPARISWISFWECLGGITYGISLTSYLQYFTPHFSHSSFIFYSSLLTPHFWFFTAHFFISLLIDLHSSLQFDSLLNAFSFQKSLLFFSYSLFIPYYWLLTFHSSFLTPHFTTILHFTFAFPFLRVHYSFLTDHFPLLTAKSMHYRICCWIWFSSINCSLLNSLRNRRSSPC